MSDAPQGPGWWQASDLKWYPPETHPSARVDRPAATTTEGTAVFVGAVPAGPPRRRTIFARRRLVVVLALLLCAGLGVTIGVVVLPRTTSPASAEHGASTTVPTTAPPFGATTVPSALVNPIVPVRPLPMGTVKLLGGPVGADGRLLAIAATPAGLLVLIAVDPATKDVAWERPFSPSAVTQGQSFEPLVIGHVVVAMTPAGPVTNGTVLLQGVDVLSGVAQWTYPEVGEATDAPAACADLRTVCVSWNGATLLELNAATGKVIRTVADVEREIGTNLYQLRTSPPALVRIGPSGEVAWTSSTPAIFGPVNNQPDFGWNVDPFGSLYVGSLGSTPPSQNEVVLSGRTTTAFRASDGHPVWTEPGLYNCEGPLAIFAAPTLCVLHGTVVRSASGSFSTAGVTAVIEGFDVHTGKVTWRRADEAVRGLTTAAPVPFVDANHLVIEERGTFLVLDLATGALIPLSSSETLWCATTPVVKVISPSGAAGGNVHIGTDQFSGCDAQGHAVARLPTTEPSIVGVTIDNQFIWPGAQGLRSEPARR
jgi:outer membrane protein assembly factor BamB